MFTRNYESFRKMMFEGRNSFSYYANSGPISFFDTLNADVGGKETNVRSPELCFKGDIGYWLTKAKCTSIPTGSKSSFGDRGGVFFGTGSTPATKNDYTLESPITSGLTINAPNVISYSNDAHGKYSLSVSFAITNTSGAEINIWEVGLVSELGGNANGATNYFPVLFDRTVLSEPITIPAGGVKLVTYKLTFNQTLNVE